MPATPVAVNDCDACCLYRRMFVAVAVLAQVSSLTTLYFVNNCVADSCDYDFMYNSQLFCITHNWRWPIFFCNWHLISAFWYLVANNCIANNCVANNCVITDRHTSVICDW